MLRSNLLFIIDSNQDFSQQKWVKFPIPWQLHPFHQALFDWRCLLLDILIWHHKTIRLYLSFSVNDTNILKVGGHLITQVALILAEHRLTHSPLVNLSEVRSRLCHSGQTEQRPDGAIVVRLFRKWSVLWCDLCSNTQSVHNQWGSRWHRPAKVQSVLIRFSIWPLCEQAKSTIVPWVRHSEERLLMSLHKKRNGYFFKS